MSQHSRRSQARLHYLFKGFADLVSVHIGKAAGAILKDKRRAAADSFRVLDLGAGSVPYGDAFEELARSLNTGTTPCKVAVTLLDKDNTLARPELAGCDCTWKVPVDILDVVRAMRESEAAPDLGGPYDLIVLSASLHEFYNDAVASRCGFWAPGTFHCEFLKSLCHDSGLLSDWGRVIIADYAWSELADPTHLEQIARAQYEFAEHADPPWSFARPRTVLEGMFRANFRLQSSESRGLFDQLDDQAVQWMLKGLEEDVRETVRLRIGYVLAFQRDSTPALPLHQSFDIQRTLLYVARRATAIFARGDVDADTVKASLNDILCTPQNDSEGAPLLTFGRQIYKDAQRVLRQYAAPDCGPFELWFGIGLQKFENSRFIPLLQQSWLSGSRSLPAGVFLDSAIANGKNQRLVAGPVSIPYQHILTKDSLLADGSGLSNPPSIHNWCVDLHRAIRNIESSTFESSVLFRSLTLLSPYATPHDHAITAAWGSEEKQRKTGHYLIRLFPEDNGQVDMRLLTARLLGNLNSISRAVAGVPVSWCARTAAAAGPPDDVGAIWLYAIFLTVVFGLGDRQQIIGNSFAKLDILATDVVAHSAALGFQALKLELAKYADSLSTTSEPASFSTYTTLALGCDGLSDEDPNTVMLFSGRPIPPAALEQIARYTFDLSSPLVQAEYTSIARKEAATHADLETTERLIPAFGHDAKQPAAVIAGLLNNSELSAETKLRAGRLLAEHLQERLAGFSSIVTPKRDREQHRRELWQRPPAIAELYPKPIGHIFKESLASAVLSICFNQKGAAWIQLRKHLGVSTAGQLEAIVSAYPRFDDMRKLLSAFAEPVIDCDSLWTPEAIQIEGDYQTYPVYHALRLMFSEIVSNALKYELFHVIKKDPSACLNFSMNCAGTVQADSLSRCGAQAVSATLTVRISPARSAHRDWIPDTFNGLLSLRSLSSAIGAEIPELAVRWKTAPDTEQHQDSVPEFVIVPFFKRDLSYIEWTIKDIPLFRNRK